MTFTFYADTADDESVVAALDEGLVSGVTTNPEILQRQGLHLADLERLVPRWVQRGAQRVFLQTWGRTTDAMLHNAQDLLAIDARVAVKVPATSAGAPVVAELAQQGVDVLVTAVYTPAQVVLAASLGAHSVAPYLGRMDDIGRDGAAEIGLMAELLADSTTKVLAASLRTPERIVALAQRGVASFTARPAVIREMFTDSPSSAAADAFERAMQGVTGA